MDKIRNQGMWKKIVLLITIIFLIAPTTMAFTLSDTAPWPSFRHDGYNTAKAAKTGPHTLPAVYILKDTGTSETPITTPVVDKDNTVYMGNNGVFYALKIDAKNNNEKWAYNDTVEQDIFNPILIKSKSGDEQVAFAARPNGTADYDIYLLDAATGSVPNNTSFPATYPYQTYTSQSMLQRPTFVVCDSYLWTGINNSSIAINESGTLIDHLPANPGGYWPDGDGPFYSVPVLSKKENTVIVGGKGSLDTNANLPAIEFSAYEVEPNNGDPYTSHSLYNLLLVPTTEAFHGSAVSAPVKGNIGKLKNKVFFTLTKGFICYDFDYAPEYEGNDPMHDYDNTYPLPKSFDLRINGAESSPNFDPDALIATDGPPYFISSPAINEDNQTIYVGGYYTEAKGAFYALTLDDSGNFVKKWHRILEGKIYSSPVIDSDGYIYIGTALDASHGILYCIKDNGVGANPNIVWQKDLGSPILSSPAIGNNNHIYVIPQSGKVFDLYEDNDAPVITINDPVDNTAFGTSEVIVTGTIMDTNLKEYSINKPTAKPLTVNADGTFSVTCVLPHGKHNITITAKDTHGHTATKTVNNITVDLCGPNFMIATSPSNTQLGKTFSVIGSITDEVSLNGKTAGSGIGEVIVKVKNVEKYATVAFGINPVTKQPTSQSIYTASFNDGEDGLVLKPGDSVPIKVTAADKVGNITTKETTRIVDNTPPIIGNIQMDNKLMPGNSALFYSNNKSPVITWGLNENINNISKTDVYLAANGSNEYTLVGFAPSGASTYTLDLSASPDEYYSIKLVAYDQMLNASAPAHRIFVLDTKSPIATLVSTEAPIVNPNEDPICKGQIILGLNISDEAIDTLVYGNKNIVVNYISGYKVELAKKQIDGIFSIIQSLTKPAYPSLGDALTSGAPNSYSFNQGFTNLASGEYEYSVTGLDQVDHNDTGVNAYKGNFIVDKTGPAIDLQCSSPQTTLSPTFSIIINDNYINIKSARLYVEAIDGNNLPIASCAMELLTDEVKAKGWENTAYQLKATLPLIYTKYRAYVRAYDILDNFSQSEYKLFEIKEPTLNLNIVPSPVQAVIGPKTIFSLTATGPYPITEYSVSINGNPAKYPAINQDGSAQFNCYDLGISSALVTGDNTISIKAKDSVGHEIKVVNTYTADVTLPVLLENGKQLPNTVTDEVVFKFNVQDVNTGINNVKVDIYYDKGHPAPNLDGMLLTTLSPGDDYNTTAWENSDNIVIPINLSTSISEKGLYKYRLFITDDAGNEYVSNAGKFSYFPGPSNVEMVTNHNQVTLNWDNNLSDNEYYIICRSKKYEADFAALLNSSLTLSAWYASLNTLENIETLFVPTPEKPATPAEIALFNVVNTADFKRLTTEQLKDNTYTVPISELPPVGEQYYYYVIQTNGTFISNITSNVVTVIAKVLPNQAYTNIAWPNIQNSNLDTLGKVGQNLQNCFIVKADNDVMEIHHTSGNTVKDYYCKYKNGQWINYDEIANGAVKVKASDQLEIGLTKTITWYFGGKI